MTDAKILQVTAESLAAGGRAVARAAGKVIFVPGLAPGDRALIEITRTHASYSEARVKALFKAGPHRVEPGCGHFPRCGGCQWLHVSEAGQLEEKTKDLRAQLRHFPALQWEPPLAAEKGELRTRVRLHVKAGRLGYYAQGSRRLEPIEKCPAMAPELAALLPALGKLVARWFEDYPDYGLIDDLQLDLDGAGRMTLLVRLNKSDAEAGRLLLSAVSKKIPFKGLAAAHAGASSPLDSRGDLELSYELPGGEAPLTLQYSPFAFVQSSHALNRKLVAVMHEWIGPCPGRGTPLSDLFCGMGNFSLPLAAAGFAVTAIESGELPITLLRENAKRAGLKIDARTGDACAPERLPTGGIVLLDPPRTGASGLAPRLKASKPRKVIYVSCDAATLGRDLREFAANGYVPQRARLLDLFPGTAHYETLVELQPE